MIRLSSARVLVLAALTALPAAAAEADYNLPPAVTGTMGADAAMVKMETPVKPEVLEAFKKSHPAKFWVFGEDRQLAVRNRIIPAHWFEDGAKQYQHFAGVARPGEFYVFQVCVVPGEERVPLACKVEIEGMEGAQTTVFFPKQPDYDVFALYNFDQRPFFASPEATKDQAVISKWIGIQIPEKAMPGLYSGTVRTGFWFDPSNPSDRPERAERFPFENLSFTLKVEGEPLADSGIDEAWRLTRLKWLDSTVGRSDSVVTRPFCPVRIDKQALTLDILGRRLKLGPMGIPAQLSSAFSPSNTGLSPGFRDAFADAPRLEA